MPVYLRSGFTQRLIFLPSKNTDTLVRGLSLPITNLIGLVLAKNCSDVDTTLSPTALVCTPLPSSLFCGLILEELPTEADLTEDLALAVFVSPRELIDVNEGEVPTQFTMNELWRLEKLSLLSSLAIKISKRLVFVSTTKGSTL